MMRTFPLLVVVSFFCSVFLLLPSPPKRGRGVGGEGEEKPNPLTPNSSPPKRGRGGKEGEPSPSKRGREEQKTSAAPKVVRLTRDGSFKQHLHGSPDGR